MALSQRETEIRIFWGGRWWKRAMKKTDRAVACVAGRQTTKALWKQEVFIEDVREVQRVVSLDRRRVSKFLGVKGDECWKGRGTEMWKNWKDEERETYIRGYLAMMSKKSKKEMTASVQEKKSKRTRG